MSFRVQMSSEVLVPQDLILDCHSLTFCYVPSHFIQMLPDIFLDPMLMKATDAFRH